MDKRRRVFLECGQTTELEREMIFGAHYINIAEKNFFCYEQKIEFQSTIGDVLKLRCPNSRLPNYIILSIFILTPSN